MANQLTGEKVVELRRLYKTGKHSYEDLANKYDIGESTARSAVKGRSWKSVNDIEPPPKKRIEKLYKRRGKACQPHKSLLTHPKTHVSIKKLVNAKCYTPEEIYRIIKDNGTTMHNSTLQYCIKHHIAKPELYTTITL